MPLFAFWNFREFLRLVDKRNFGQNKMRRKRKMKHHAENRASISLHRMFDWSGIIIIGKRSNHKSNCSILIAFPQIKSNEWKEMWKQNWSTVLHSMWKEAHSSAEFRFRKNGYYHFNMIQMCFQCRWVSANRGNFSRKKSAVRLMSVKRKEMTSNLHEYRNTSPFFTWGSGELEHWTLDDDQVFFSV